MSRSEDNELWLFISMELFAGGRKRKAEKKIAQREFVGAKRQQGKLIAKKPYLQRHTYLRNLRREEWFVKSWMPCLLHVYRIVVDAQLSMAVVGCFGRPPTPLDTLCTHWTICVQPTELVAHFTHTHTQGRKGER